MRRKIGMKLIDSPARKILRDPIARAGRDAHRPAAGKLIDREIRHANIQPDCAVAAQAVRGAAYADLRTAEIDLELLEIEAVAALAEGPARFDLVDLDVIRVELMKIEVPMTAGEIKSERIERIASRKPRRDMAMDGQGEPRQRR